MEKGSVLAAPLDARSDLMACLVPCMTDVFREGHSLFVSEARS